MGDVIKFPRSLAPEKFIDDFLADMASQNKLKKPLSAALKQYGLDVPSTKAGYRSLIESVRLQGPSSQEIFILLLKSAKAASEYYEALDATQLKVEKLTYHQRRRLAVYLGFILTCFLMEPANNAQYTWASNVLFSNDSPELRQMADVMDCDAQAYKKIIIDQLREEGFCFDGEPVTKQ